MNIQNLATTKLTPHPDNPRKHSKTQIKQIAHSIERFGFKLPVLVDKDHQIICGHGRVLACKQLGKSTVPCIIADDLNESEVRALMIADNKLTENSEWDQVLLAKNFEILSDLNLDFDLEITGFEYGDIEQLLIEHETSEHSKQNVKDDEVIERPIEAPNLIVTEPGDVWQLGQHRIICGDSLDKQSYKTLLGKKKADIIFTDPPYNLSPKAIGKICQKAHGAFQHASGEMQPDEFIEFLTSIFAHLTAYSKQGSIHYVCMDWRHIQEILQAGQAHYSEFKNLCIWAKDKAGMGTFYRNQHELIFVFKHGKTKHQNHFKLGQHGRTRSNVWHYPTARHLVERNGDVAGTDVLNQHPTIKPVQMIEDALLDCSKRNQRVLDPFLGSGTTLIAAEKTARHCFGIEIEPRYVDVAIRRWQNWTGQDAIHVASGETYQYRLIEKQTIEELLCA